MKYINTLHEGETIREIYLCKGKRTAETRNGKPYDNLILQDKTGTLDGKVWSPNSNGIADYDEKDFVDVYGEVISYNGYLQLNIKQLRVASEEEYNALISSAEYTGLETDTDKAKFLAEKTISRAISNEFGDILGDKAA